MSTRKCCFASVSVTGSTAGGSFHRQASVSHSVTLRFRVRFTAAVRVSCSTAAVSNMVGSVTGLNDLASDQHVCLAVAQVYNVTSAVDA
jgi:hypothetical protein